MRESDIDRLCTDRGWSRGRLALELRQAARRTGLTLPADESLKRMIRQWVNGDRSLSEMYADLFSLAFGVAFEVASDDDSGDGPDTLAQELGRVGSALDGELVDLFEQQTQSFRTLDRRLGARRLLAQTESHVHQMTDLLAFALCGASRSALAEAVAEAAALAGWQALDLGRPDRSWMLHETAKSAARDSGNPAVIAHVSAQQAFALLDLDRPRDAVQQVRHARREAAGKVPAVLEAWLWAAEAEALAAAGAGGTARTALDAAAEAIERSEDDQLAYLFLDGVHLARWRGHCLARVGAGEAIVELTAALEGLDPSFTRARAGLLVDLAVAHAGRGEQDAAHARAAEAHALAEATTSARQKKRILRLLPDGVPLAG